MTTMLLSWNGTREIGQFIGDTVCSIKVAWLFAQAHPCDKYIITMSPSCDLNFLWQKWINTFGAEVVYDDFHPGNVEQRWSAWDKWRTTREIDGKKFDIYKELYRRIDGARRQAVLCGGEKGLGKKNIFEYFYYGQESVTIAPESIKEFGDDLIYHPVRPPERAVYVAPFAKCQGNAIFTFDYWSQVVHRLIDAGLTVTVNHDKPFCEDLNGNPFYRKIYPEIQQLFEEIASHKIVACGNTGIGWVAGAIGTPLLAMQPVDSNMQDYRYEWCGVKSLVEFLPEPNVDYCVKRILEEVNHQLVITTGCYDVLHAGHVRHLEESRQLGSKLIVCLNSDASVRQMKGPDRPINPQAQRETVLRALRCVDDVRIFDGLDALPIIEELRPMFITNGPDHKLEEIVGKEFVEQYGGKAFVTSGTRTVSSTKIIQKTAKVQDVLKAIRDAVPYSVNPFSKLKLLADQAAAVMHLPGAVADLGTYRGGCALILRRIAPDKDLHLFDTWQGNPFDDELCHHKKGEWVGDLSEVRVLVGQDFNTHYHVGIFPETTKKIEDAKFCFAFIDPDTYQSVKDAILWFWPRLVSGGKLMFDDYDWFACAGVKKAVDEAFNPEDRMVFEREHACVVVKK